MKPPSRVKKEEVSSSSSSHVCSLVTRITPRPNMASSRERRARGRLSCHRTRPTRPSLRFRRLPPPPTEPVRTPPLAHLSYLWRAPASVQTVNWPATWCRMQGQDEVERMRALLVSVGVQRCTSPGAPPPTQCGQGKAACGCGKKPPCHFTLAELEQKVRALPRPHSPLQLRFSVCSCARRRENSLESSLGKTVRSRQRFLSQCSGWMESCCALRALWRRRSRRTGPWSASH